MSQRSEKVEKDVNASTANKLLVICIDRDNDVGEKAQQKDNRQSYGPYNYETFLSTNHVFVLPGPGQ